MTRLDDLENQQRRLPVISIKTVYHADLASAEKAVKARNAAHKSGGGGRINAVYITRHVVGGL
ncbi:MAG: hypothetical protein KDJ31_04805 [Candidatus Competibacteraceae bacterium]|nr:hypothetical protein [Candidatus Competibacteraceae bacterium]